MFKVKEIAFFSCSKPLKETNEDACLLPVFDDENGILFGIADGVGSNSGAKSASHIAIDAARKEFLLGRESFSLGKVFSTAKNKISNLVSIDSSFSRAATTLTLVNLKDDTIFIGHIGDCRLYFKDCHNKLVQLTKDHTRYQELLDSKEFSKNKLTSHKERLSSILTSAISANYEDVNYEISSYQLGSLNISDDELFLYVMSDGAYKFWEKRPKLSLRTMSSATAFTNSIRRRIEKEPSDDYTLLALVFERS